MLGMTFRFSTEVQSLGVRGMYYNIHNMQNLPSTDPNVSPFVLDQLTSILADSENVLHLRGSSELHARISKRPKKLRASPVGLLSFLESTETYLGSTVSLVYNAVSLSTPSAPMIWRTSKVTSSFV